METVIAFAMKYIMEALFRWGTSFFKKKQKMDSIDASVDSKRDRVIDVLKAAPKGELMTNEQRKELYEAYLDLTRP